MIGYKGVNHDFTAHNNFKYTIGKTYNLPENKIPKLCDSGFHFCTIPLLVFHYYNNQYDRYLLVHATGAIDSDDMKCCTNQIKILQEIDYEKFHSESFQLQYIQEHKNLITGFTDENKHHIYIILCKMGYFQIIKYLIKEYHINDEILLVSAARYGRLEVLKYIIEECKFVFEDFVVFIMAARYGHLEIIQYFIETHKYDPHFNYEWGMRVAAMNGHLEVLKYFIETHNCDPHAESEQSLRLAIENGHINVVQYLKKCK